MPALDPSGQWPVFDSDAQFEQANRELAALGLSDRLGILVGAVAGVVAGTVAETLEERRAVSAGPQEAGE